MLWNISEPGFDGIGFKSKEDLKTMRPQHLAAHATVRAGEGRVALVCADCRVWVATNYVGVSLRNWFSC